MRRMMAPAIAIPIIAPIGKSSSSEGYIKVYHICTHCLTPLILIYQPFIRKMHRYGSWVSTNYDWIQQ